MLAAQANSLIGKNARLKPSRMIAPRAPPRIEAGIIILAAAANYVADGLIKLKWRRAIDKLASL